VQVCEGIRLQHDSLLASEEIGSALLSFVRGHGKARRPLAFLCIGTDRSTGDALGPLVGTALVELGVKPERVFGTLDAPVHASNLIPTLAALEDVLGGAFVVAVDACLGRAENVGTITVGPGPLSPGAGVHKTLPAVGSAFVTGTVNVSGFMEYFVLQNTRLRLVMTMAEVISRGLHRCAIALDEALDGSGAGGDGISAPGRGHGTASGGHSFFWHRLRGTSTERVAGAARSDPARRESTAGGQG